MGFSLKHDNQTPTLKREYNKYSEVLVSKISLFYSSSKLQTPPLFSITSRGSMCALDKRMGGGGELVPGKQGGMEALHQLVLRTHYALRATHYVALRTTCKRGAEQAEERESTGWCRSKLQAPRQPIDGVGGTEGGGGGHQGGTRRVPRGAPTNLTVTRR